jgi:predicted Zn-dependent peptidase
MRPLKFIIPKLIILITVISVPAFGRISDVGEYLKANVVHRTLRNGIDVLILNRGYAPALALTISFRTGSVNESYDNIGIAHMLEHMLFKGTDEIGTTDFKKEKPILDRIEETGERIDDLKRKNRDPEETERLGQELKKLQDEEQKYIISSPYSRIYSENGAVGFNASTSKDMTIYYIELPASRLELWADLESKRLRNPVFREFYIERKAVLEERLMRYETQGSGSLFEKFLAIAFMAHPYRHPVIGWRSNIENFSIKDIRDFYQRNYIPSRMTITVVGRQDVEKTFRLLDKYFGGLEPRKEPRETVIVEPAQDGERRFDLYFESNPYLIIGWHKPTFPSRTDYVFDIISSLLSDGKTSRLYKSLVIEKGIAASVDAYNGYPGFRYDNLFIITGAPKKPAGPEELERAIYNEIDMMMKDISEDDIKKVINKIESSFVFDLDNNMGIARLLSYYETNFSNWEYAVDYLKILRTITSQDIKDALKNHITEKNRTVGILRNKNAN